MTTLMTRTLSPAQREALVDLVISQAHSGRIRTLEALERQGLLYYKQGVYYATPDGVRIAQALHLASLRALAAHAELARDASEE